MIHVNKTFEVKTIIIEEMRVSFAQSDDHANPEQYEIGSGSFPLAQFPVKNTDEMPFLHLQIQTVFFGDAEMEEYPRSVCLVLEGDNSKLISHSVHADFIP